MKRKIYIDARMIQSTGIGTYLQGLLPNLLNCAEYDFVLMGDTEKLRTRYPSVQTIDLKAEIYSVKEQWQLLKSARKANLVHSPHYNASLFGFKPLVVTIHDLTHFRFPGDFGGRSKLKAAKIVMSSALRRAKKIIAVSKATRDDIIQTFQVDPKKIKVIYEGAGQGLQKTTDVERVARHLPEFYLKPNYFLYVGNLKTYKNIPRLIEAFNSLRKKGLKEEFVVVGKLDLKMPDAVRLTQLLKSDGIHYLGYVSDEALSAIFSFAKALIFPSLWEGFGLPILEAFQLGVPVACSNIPSHREIAGEDGLYFDPKSLNDIENAIRKLSGDSDLRDGLVLNGHVRLSRFSWEGTARETLKVYREVLGG